MGCLQLNISILNLAFKFNSCEGIAKAIHYEEGKHHGNPAMMLRWQCLLNCLERRLVYEDSFWRCI